MTRSIYAGLMISKFDFTSRERRLMLYSSAINTRSVALNYNSVSNFQHVKLWPIVPGKSYMLQVFFFVNPLDPKIIVK